MDAIFLTLALLYIAGMMPALAAYWPGGSPDPSAWQVALWVAVITLFWPVVWFRGGIEVCR